MSSTALRRFPSNLQAPIAILALALVALRPILGPSLPCSDDAAFHLLRLTQLDHLLRQGVWYSRWAPDMAQGYGFPFFNFYAPLSYYAANGVSWLAQNLNLGLRLTFALGMYASGLAAYRLVRDHFSVPASLVAAVAYMYAPYQAYDILFRGNLAESAAWPLLPLALWCMGRLARSGRRRWLVATSLSYAAVLLTHNVFALIFSPLLALYGIVNSQQSTVNSQQLTGNSRRSFVAGPWLLVGLSLLLGLGLAAFFWLPALLERHLVHSDRLLVPPIFVYWGNFVTLAELLAAPRVVWPDLLNPSPPRALGLAPSLVALPGLLLGWWRFKNGRRRQVLFFGSATIICIFLMTAASEPVWASLPLLEYVQFPWRLLGLAALALAVLGAASVDVLQRPDVRRGAVTYLAAAFFCLTLILANLYWLDARYCPGLEAPTVADMQAFERESHTIGTTAKGEYLPRTADYVPEAPVLEPFAPLPPTADLLSAQRRPLRFQAQIQAAEPFVLTANTFYYPGWRAWINGAPAAITPSPGAGLITLVIPPGEHNVTIRFGETPLRLAADAISVVSLIALTALTLSRRRERSAYVRRPATTSGGPVYPFTLLGLALFAVVALWSPALLYRPGLPQLEAVATYAGNLTLLEPQIGGQTIAADETLAVNLAWSVSQPVDSNYRSTLRLVGSNDQVWSPMNSERPRRFRFPSGTRFWQPGQYAEDQHLLTPLAGTPPGQYSVQLILFEEETLVPVAADGGQAAFDLGSVTVTRPRRPATPQPQYASAANWGDVELVGYNLDREEAAPGDPFLLTLFWRTHETPGADYSVRLALAGPDNDVHLALDLPPVRADLPATLWQPGDVWRGQHSFHLPVHLESDTYRWLLSLCDVSCAGTAAAELGRLTIQAPDRLFTPPQLDLLLGAQLGDVATLLGATIEQEADLLRVTLAWQATVETTTSYRVFVHLVDSDGQLVAQSDGDPANWSRPTTGWLPGEIIVDAHELNITALAAGRYMLYAGLYDATTGQRLALPDGATAVSMQLTINN